MRIALVYPAAQPLSARSWSGIPQGLSNGLTAHGCEVVAVGCSPSRLISRGLDWINNLSGRSGVTADSSSISSFANTELLKRNLSRVDKVCGVVAMGTTLYELTRIVSGTVPVATFDDATFALFERNPHSDVRRAKVPEADIHQWAKRQARAARFADSCCVTSEWAARSFVEDYAVPAANVHVVGIGHRPRTPPSTTKDWSKPRYLFVGINWGRKNGEAVVRAFAEVRARYPDATLDLVGSHPPIDAPNVTSHGLLPRLDTSAQARLDDLYAKATVFVMPSLLEPFGIVYLEAASAGLPVVGTSEGGAGEYIGPGFVAVPPSDHARLTEAMLHLADPEVARTLGEAAMTRAATSTWQMVAGRVLSSLNLLGRS